MELLQIGNYFVAYQRAGNDKNGNSIWLVNIFQESAYRRSGETFYNNITFFVARGQNSRMDKNGNIRLQSYNIETDVKNMVERLEG